MKKIAIIDYGFGNIKSVQNALNFCGAEPVVINSPDKISDFNGAILPGVGAFAPAAEFLVKDGFDCAIRQYVASGKMLYGICLGFQLFFTKGYEGGQHKGLGLLNGEVKKFEFKNNNLKIPHMGWNGVKINNTPEAKKMFAEISDGENFYFVHSYYAKPENNIQVSSFCNYGIDFCSSAAFENVWGSQFHPEKSGGKGLQILKNFLGEVK
ncbi:imidazole glycerol phosphate synthase subunit HisH [Endomicrobium proavitum]|uniref:Imidazole glycerol phosphate synthase subunit HisH n=1 Tax=Endomicrobium proavitum TaxID=1408281 RepID=A0A0G3WIT5_9BACT|nr:imidazole glycerol phosphate synthase subunit HisH [Endomicrobium proavitum]AKL97800.1 Imidazole glycerol phosphate synthase subunit HisH [Endomicrobium proavitum]